VLVGGYYYPSARIDALLTAPVALPVLGDVMRYTVTAISARLMLKRLVRAMFAPREVPGHFIPALSREMMVRPIQLRANAEDAAFMIPQAKASSGRHHELRMPVAIVAGADDKVIDAEAHSARLHREVAGSTLVVVPGRGIWCITRLRAPSLRPWRVSRCLSSPPSRRPSASASRACKHDESLAQEEPVPQHVAQRR
jgi:pimeloyl-ACP methyl ester carboxylesterase